MIENFYPTSTQVKAAEELMNTLYDATPPWTTTEEMMLAATAFLFEIRPEEIICVSVASETQTDECQMRRQTICYTSCRDG